MRIPGLDKDMVTEYITRYVFPGESGVIPELSRNREKAFALQSGPGGKDLQYGRISADAVPVRVTRILFL